MADLPAARRILALADDLTGALEAGAQFAASGLESEVAVGPFPSRARVHVVDTESRHLSPEQAQYAVEAALEASSSFWLLYKKTDSALRGNIAAELSVLHRAFPALPLLYAPAYPALGRTVRNSVLFLDGVPVTETAFARDALNPVREGDVRRLLRNLPVRVLDGETDADVQAAAAEVLAHDPPALAVGPAALAGALARRIGRGSRPLEAPAVGRCLVVNGSRHAASLEQIRTARAEGVFNEGWELFDETVSGEGLSRARRLGRRVARRVRQGSFDALAVFGGDTAYGIHAAFGAPVFRALGEIVEGVPLSRAANLLWITKAGGFGEPGVLGTIRRRLS